MLIIAKLTDKQKKKIIADYVETQNYSETARINNVNEKTARRIIKEQDNEDMVKKAEQKKLENTQTTLEYMEEQHQTKKEIIDNLLNAINEKSKNVDMFTNVRDLATAYGILIDKELKYAEIKSNTNINTEKNGILNELIGALNKAKEDK